MITELDAYFDAAPRSDSNPIDVGAFTLFISQAPFGYYARPATTQPNPIVQSDLVALEEACAENNVIMSIEWVHEVHPELMGLAAAHGLEIRSHALMVASAGDVTALEIDGATLRIIQPDEPAMESGRAVADLAFSFGGTNIGLGGPTDRDAKVPDLNPALMEHLRERHRRGLTIT
ncbi:MAG: hypothetical protein NTX12_08065, partial [Actinobacteria bacterium]|nr:hypothetical protein [Actinomycetota bacterium]